MDRYPAAQRRALPPTSESPIVNRFARPVAALAASAALLSRVAIRAEIKAIRAELRAARLTAAERATLRAQAAALCSAMLAPPTAAMARTLCAECAKLTVSLRCHLGNVSAPPVAGL